MRVYIAYRPRVFGKVMQAFDVDEGTSIEDILEAFGAKKLRDYHNENIETTAEEWFGSAKKNTGMALKNGGAYMLAEIVDMDLVEERFQKVNETELYINEVKTRRILSSAEDSR